MIVIMNRRADVVERGGGHQPFAFERAVAVQRLQLIEQSARQEFNVFGVCGLIIEEARQIQDTKGAQIGHDRIGQLAPELFKKWVYGEVCG